MHADAAPRELDILDMPLEGIAAYWLSLKKILGAKLTAKALAEEAERTREPFVRHLLEIGPAPFADDQFLALARAKGETVLADLARKLELLRTALSSISSGENPRVLLVRMLALFPVQLSEKRIVELAAEMQKVAEAGGAGGRPPEEVIGPVDHSAGADKLVVKLLFLASLARRESRGALAPYAARASAFFRQGLSLLADGFEEDFVRCHAERASAELLAAARAKIELSVQMVLGIRRKLAYEDLYLVAKSFMI
jgi:hypothetical protein